MRGDSLRDLYAKGLAVLGLGLLAGAGAVVDYWPSSLDVPRVSRGTSAPKPALARVLRADYTPELLTPAPRPTMHAVAAAESPSPAAATPLPDMPVITSPIVLAFDRGVSLGTTAVSFGSQPVASVTTVGTEVALSAPEFVTREASASADLPMLSPGSAADADGFLTGAVKKTGTSIIRGGVKTGASIRDAMRAIGGAVRRAFPG